MPVEGSVSHLELCRDAYIQHWSFQPKGQVTTDAGSCLTVLSVFGNIGPGTGFRPLVQRRSGPRVG
jgi:hypothetical protein